MNYPSSTKTTDKYMPKIKHNLGGVGNPEAKILLIIDHPDKEGMTTGKILTRQNDGAFQEVIHMADLISSDIYIQALVPDDPRPKAWWKAENTNKPLKDITPLIPRACDLIQSSNANVVVAMGDLTTYILTGQRKLRLVRGYTYACILEGLEHVKVIPVQDIKGMIWANYINRYYLASDLQKASEEAKTSEFIYDQSEIRILTDFEAARQCLKLIRKDCVSKDLWLSVDIEIENFEISNIGFGLVDEACVGEKVGLSLPFKNKLWTVEQETQLWFLTAELLGDERITKVGQNFIFDIHFLLMRNNIYTKGPIVDTMMGQSIIFPDFLKGLGFLGSTYINVPEWKTMVNFVGGDIKDNG